MSGRRGRTRWPAGRPRLLSLVLPATTPLPLRELAAIVVVMHFVVSLVLPAVTRMDEPWLQRGLREGG